MYHCNEASGTPRSFSIDGSRIATPLATDIYTAIVNTSARFHAYQWRLTIMATVQVNVVNTFCSLLSFRVLVSSTPTEGVDDMVDACTQRHTRLTVHGVLLTRHQSSPYGHWHAYCGPSFENFWIGRRQIGRMRISHDA
jgi:hypothetical protein